MVTPQQPGNIRLVQDMVLAIERGEIQSSQDIDDYVANQAWNGGPPWDLINSVRNAHPLITRSNSLQADMFGEQDLRDVFLRGINKTFNRDIGSFSPVGQRAMSNAFSRFQAQEPIRNFTGQHELGDSFAIALRQPEMSPSSLGTSLSNILNLVSQGGFTDDGGLQFADPNANTASQRPLTPEENQAQLMFGTRFNDPNIAARTAFQPFLSGVAPRLRSAVSNNLSDRFDTQIASNPLSFDTSQQRFNLMDHINRMFNTGLR
jgi:hypothetical protein